MESDQVTGPELAVDGQIEKGELAQVSGELESESDRPDLLELERRLLPNELAAIPSGPFARLVHDVLLSQIGGRTWAHGRLLLGECQLSARSGRLRIATADCMRLNNDRLFKAGRTQVVAWLAQGAD
jgi:hypothetical protein